MSLIKISGKEKEDYLTSLDRSLEVMATLKTGTEEDLEKIRKIINFFSFDQYYGTFESMKIDDESGLPLLTTIQDLIIDQDKAQKMLEKHPDEETIREKIRDSCYENNFDLAKLQQELRIVDFYQDLLNAEILYKRISELKEVKKKEWDVRNFSVTVKGYDSAKMSWTFYEMELFQKGEKSALLQKSQLSPDFDDFFSFCFSHGLNVVYDKIKEKKNLAPGVITRTHLNGFYFLGKKNGIDFEAILSDKPDATILVLESKVLEDTDLILSEELDKEVLSKKYEPDFLEETKRFYVCSPDIKETLIRHCRRNRYEFVVESY